MADKPLFNLDTKGRWRLAYDREQWMIQRRAGKPCQRGSDSAAMRRTGWKAVSLRRRQEDDAGAVIPREGHRPDHRGVGPARRAA